MNTVEPYDDVRNMTYDDQEPVDFPVWSWDPAREDIFSEEALGVPNRDPAEKWELF